MARRHNTILHDRVALAAAAVPLEKDLPINPISFITIVLRLINDSAVSAIPTIFNMLGTIANVEVLLDGRSLAQGSLTDLAVLTQALWGVPPLLQPLTKTDDNVLHCVVHIPFGRRAWIPNEALPTTRKGDLVLRLTPAAAFTGVQTLTLTVEVRQVLDVAPERFLKYVTSTKTPTATGEHEVDLLTGPDYLGVLFFGTTAPCGAAQLASIAKLKLKVDDVEQMIPESRWESLFGEWHARNPLSMYGAEHIHVMPGAAYAQYMDTGRPQYVANLWDRYIYVDFDPVKDLGYRLITRGRSRCHFVLTADVADAIRFLPVELVALTAEATPGA
jgi:hypothetical protein